MGSRKRQFGRQRIRLNQLSPPLERNMKQLLITMAALMLVGCGGATPNISIQLAAEAGNIQAIKQHIAAGTDVNVKNFYDYSFLHSQI